MNKIFCALFLMCFVTNSNYSQVVAPLNGGNIWVYENDSGRWKSFVEDTMVVIDDINYFRIGFDNLRLNEDNFYVIRRDTTFPMPNHEQIYYKKNAIKGDSWETNFSNEQVGTSTVTDTFQVLVFDKLVTIKNVHVDFGIVIRDEVWTDEFGLLTETDLFTTFKTLKGCVIDGVVYGDTSMVTVGVDDDSVGV